MSENHAIITIENGMGHVIQGDALLIDFDLSALGDDNDLENVQKDIKQAKAVNAPKWIIEKLEALEKPLLKEAALRK